MIEVGVFPSVDKCGLFLDAIDDFSSMDVWVWCKSVDEISRQISEEQSTYLHGLDASVPSVSDVSWAVFS